MAEELVLTRRRGKVLEIVMNRPPANAINRTMSRAMYKAFHKLQNDSVLLIGLRQYRGGGLLQNLKPHELPGFGCHVCITNAGFGCLELLTCDLQHVHRYFDSRLERADLSALTRELLALVPKDRERLTGGGQCLE